MSSSARQGIAEDADHLVRASRHHFFSLLRDGDYCRTNVTLVELGKCPRHQDYCPETHPSRIQYCGKYSWEYPITHCRRGDSYHERPTQSATPATEYSTYNHFTPVNPTAGGIVQQFRPSSTPFPIRFFFRNQWISTT